MRLVYLQIFLLTFGAAFSQSNCDKYANDYVPKNLDDALSYLTCVWSDHAVFKNGSEKDAVAEVHFSQGRWIRNSWGLMDQKGSLYRQFKSLGITFPEDISSIILTSFHRHLNNKDIDLASQVREYKEYKKQFELVKLERDRMANDLKVGDTVNVMFSRHRETKNTYNLALLNYESLVDKPTNCSVQGQVKQKKKENGSSIITITITNITNCDSAYYDGKPMNIGQTFSYNMTYFNLATIPPKN